MNASSEQDRMDHQYTLAKFSSALEKLATEPGDVLARLPIAAREIAGIGPSHVPDDLSEAVQWIKKRVIPDYDLTQEEAVRVARRICDVEAALRSYVHDQSAT